MEFEINPQRQAYLDARGRVILNACPGSGKTTCIIKKLALLEKECLEKHGNYSGIVCLSFTNVAKNEILHKYKQTYGYDFKYPNLVSTIDSFINQFITLPFYNLLNSSFGRPQIIDRAGIIDRAISTRYQKDGKWMESIQSPMNRFKNKANRPLYVSYPPSKIWIDVNGRFTFEGKSPNTSIVDPIVFQEYGTKLFEWKAKKGLLTSLDSAYIALLLLRKHQNIGKWLSERFPYIIIDEAQDNSEIQHAIFDELINLGHLNIEMIGDPYQSLYEWRDAKPQLFVEKYTNGNWTGLPLSQNRRSVQRIINCFSILRNSLDEIISSVSVDDLMMPIIVYKYNETNSGKIINDFEERCVNNEFTKNHIVVRGTTLKDKMLGNVSDVNPWKNDFPSDLLNVKHYFETNAIKNAVNELRKMFTALLHPELEYKELQKKHTEYAEDHKLNSRLYDFLYKIPSTDLSFQDWTDKCVEIISIHLDFDSSSLFIFKQKINGFKMVDLKKQSVNLYFNKSATNKHNIPITTIHQIKGATLDAILYFFDANSSGESVSFNDFKASLTFPSEKQRMIYVACSRPKQLLALAFPDRITDIQIKERFGGDVDIVIL